MLRSYLVAHPVDPPTNAPLWLSRSRGRQRLLQLLVEDACPRRPPMHRAEHLHVAARIQAKLPGQAVGDDVDDEVGDLLRVILGEKKEVVEALGDGHLASVDAVGIGDDAALLGLPDYVRCA